MSDRVKAEIVKWALWNASILAGITIISLPPGYPLRVWKWKAHEEQEEQG